MTDPPLTFADFRRLSKEKGNAGDSRFKDLKPIKRDLLNPNVNHDETRSIQEIDAMRKALHDLKVSPFDSVCELDIPAPVLTFAEAVPGNEALLNEFKRVGFEKPSPIQSQMWPCLMRGIDCVGVSQTGSGKTLAFLIPAFLHCDAQLSQYADHEEKPCPSVLVLTPTRELAIQIQGEVEKYSYNGYKSICLYGGAGRNEQIAACNSGVQIAIATPGRLADLASENVVKLKSVSYVVLDEADRMLDMGFEADIRRIMLEIRPDRLTVLTSATWPESVRGLAAKYLKNAAMIVVGSLDLSACKAVTQHFEYFESDEDKAARLKSVIRYLRETNGDNFKLIIFVAKKVFADDVSSDLCMAGINSQALHGGRSQQDREKTLQSFRDGTVRILIATDLASRGIDVPNITHVINYDFPSDIEEYVHRVGRTGRAGKTGEALTFLTYRNQDIATKLMDILQKSNQIIPEGLHSMAERHQARLDRGWTPRGRGGGGGGGRGRRDNFQSSY